MRIFFFAVFLAMPGIAQAAEPTITAPQVVHIPGERLGAPMAWKYNLLRAAEDEFKKHEARLAPGATLAFKLPNVDETQGDNEVDIVTSAGRIRMPMVSTNIFALPRGAEAFDGNAMIEVNREFPKGSFRHPNVQVRSPGLAEGVKRMGDLRLACAVQVAMAKAHELKFRALLVAASLFGDLCEEMQLTNIGASAGPYDTVAVEDGDRRITRPRAQAAELKLGDRRWSDNARISYFLDGQIVD